MRREFRPCGFLVLITLFSGILPVFGQSSSPPVRDPQAVSIIQQSISAMGQGVPSDSTATGTVTLTAGSLVDSGTITILTRGTSQTSEQMQTQSGGYQAINYSNGQASQLQETTSNSLQMELVVTSQSPDFPLPFLSAAINNSDDSIQYLGQETLGNVSVLHIRFWNIFASTGTSSPLAPLSTYDVWIDASSFLLVQLSYISQPYQGTSPRTRMQVNYSNYQSFSGILYPTTINKSINGTPWAAITIQSVQFNSGLTDSSFPVH